MRRRGWSCLVVVVLLRIYNKYNNGSRNELAQVKFRFFFCVWLLCVDALGPVPKNRWNVIEVYNKRGSLLVQVRNMLSETHCGFSFL